MTLIDRARHHVRLHKWAAYAWTAFAVPTVIWWRDSIVLVLLISIYANVVGHWSAYEAARAQEDSSDD